MKYAKILAALGAVALLGAGSATLLNVYGTVSGTADVKPALKVTEIQANAKDEDGGEKIEIYNPSTAAVDLTKFTVSDGANNTLSAINSSDLPSQDYAVIVPSGYSGPYIDSVDYYKAGSALSVDNSNGVVRIWLNDLNIDNISYSGSCSESNTLQRDSLTSKSFSCGSDTIGSGGY